MTWSCHPSWRPDRRRGSRTRLPAARVRFFHMETLGGGRAFRRAPSCWRTSGPSAGRSTVLVDRPTVVVASSLGRKIVVRTRRWSNRPVRSDHWCVCDPLAPTVLPPQWDRLSVAIHHCADPDVESITQWPVFGTTVATATRRFDGCPSSRRLLSVGALARLSPNGGCPLASPSFRREQRCVRRRDIT